MKKRRFFCLLTVAVLLLISCIQPIQGEGADNISVTEGCNTIDAQKPLDESGLILETSKAAIVYDRASDTLIYAWNPDMRIYPASMVKLMTALVAWENSDFSQMTTVTKTALGSVSADAVNVGLKTGEQMSLENMMYCMMVASANDAAAVIAEHVGGTQTGFVSMMNQKARELGCTGTNFTNAHGLHDENNYTTVRDVCRILSAMLEVPILKEMFGTVRYTVPATNSSESRTVGTTNYMMSSNISQKYYDERVTGGRTGSTDEAGRCLAITAEGNDMDLICIVMGAEHVYEENTNLILSFGSFEEMAVLLDHVLDKYEMRNVFYGGQAIAQYPVTNGVNGLSVEPVEQIATVIPIEMELDKLSWTTSNLNMELRAPVKKGQRIASMEVWYGSICLAVTDLLAMHDVSDVQTYSEAIRYTKLDNPGSWTGLIIVIGVIVGIGLILLAAGAVTRVVRTLRIRIRRRRRRMERRRNR